MSEVLFQRRTRTDGITQEVWADRASWLTARGGDGLGASEVAAAVGLDPYKSPFALYCEKARLVDGDLEGESAAREWGNVLEPVIAEKFARETGRRIVDHGRFTIWRNPDLPNVFATLDREVLSFVDPEDLARGNGVLEVKAPGYLQRDRWQDGPPEHHVIQLQAQLAVTGYRWGAIAALIGGQDYRSYSIDRDDELIGLLVAGVDRFMTGVRRQEPPDVDGSESTSRVLKRLYPEDSGVVVELLEENAKRWADQLEEAKTELERWREKKWEAMNHLKALIGHASYARIGGREYSLKTKKVSRHVVEAHQFRELRLSQKKRS